MLRLVIWNFKGEEGTSHEDEKAMFGKQMFGKPQRHRVDFLISRSCWSFPTTLHSFCLFGFFFFFLTHPLELKKPKFLINKFIILELLFIGLPGDSVAGNPLCQCRRHGFNPWSGRIRHAREQLSPCARIIELCALGLGSATAGTPTPIAHAQVVPCQ